MDIGKKGIIINYLPSIFRVESEVNPLRVNDLNNIDEQEGAVIYVMHKNLRVADNFALNFAIAKAKELNRRLKIVHYQKKIEVEGKKLFYENGLQILKEDMKRNKLAFKVYTSKKLLSALEKSKPGVVIIDFDPLNDYEKYKNIECKIYEVDAQNLIPARFISQKQEYSAFQFRRLVHKNAYQFLTEFPKKNTSQSESHEVLEDFLNNKLENYAKYKNQPSLDATSGLSRYFNFGFISAQRVILEVLKCNVDNENKESFLEELIVRKELSDNFCLYNKNYKNLKGAPSWAYRTLEAHENDFRNIFYTKEEFESAKTRDEIWNLAQKDLVSNGKIHGYVRMYWAKKLLQWCKTPQEALDLAIYLNDKYAYDAPSANGYVGILWSIAGLHDRPFQERPITGKIRTMSHQNLKNRYKNFLALD